MALPAAPPLACTSPMLAVLVEFAGSPAVVASLVGFACGTMANYALQHRFDSASTWTGEDNAMILSRRRFLRLSVVGAGGATIILLAAYSATVWLRAPLRALYARLRFPGLEDAPTGPLSVGALNALLAATTTLAGVPVQLAHYEDFFRWRAEHLPGYKALYEQFAAALGLRAQRAVGCAFVDCSRQMQQKVLEERPQLRGGDSRRHKARVVVLEREWLRFDQYIVRDIFLLFLRTDAWTSLGYEAWPGTPRGLERYTQAPSQVR